MLYVSYVLAQAGTDVVTTSTKDPLLGQRPAGLTQGTRGQQPNHIILPYGTPPLTRFGATARKARVGGAQHESLVPSIGLLCALCIL